MKTPNAFTLLAKTTRSTPCSAAAESTFHVPPTLVPIIVAGSAAPSLADRREVDHDLDAGDGTGHGRPVPYVEPVDQVEARHLVPGTSERIDHGAADAAVGTGDQDPHDPLILAGSTALPPELRRAGDLGQRRCELAARGLREEPLRDRAVASDEEGLGHRPDPVGRAHRVGGVVEDRPRGALVTARTSGRRRRCPCSRHRAGRTCGGGRPTRRESAGTPRGRGCTTTPRS